MARAVCNRIVHVRKKVSALKETFMFCCVCLLVVLLLFSFCEHNVRFSPTSLFFNFYIIRDLDMVSNYYYFYTARLMLTVI